MSTQTTNLGLTKPAGNERPLVGVLNDNMDIIDDAVGDLQESVSFSGSAKRVRHSIWGSGGSAQIDILDGNGNGFIIVIEQTQLRILKTTSGTNTQIGKLVYTQ